MKLIKDLDKNKVLFAYGRNAIFSICKSLKIKQGDEILTPALDCDSTLTPFIIHDASLVFYKSDPYTFNIDIDDLFEQFPFQEIRFSKYCRGIELFNRN